MWNRTLLSLVTVMTWAPMICSRSITSVFNSRFEKTVNSVFLWRDSNLLLSQSVFRMNLGSVIVSRLVVMQKSNLHVMQRLLVPEIFGGVSVHNCVFERCTADTGSNGGAICIDETRSASNADEIAVQIHSTTFVDCAAVGQDAYGGALYFTDIGTIHVEGSCFKGCGAGYGSFMSCHRYEVSTPQIIELKLSTFTHNGYGGALGSSLDLLTYNFSCEDVNISHNSVMWDGAGMYLSSERVVDMWRTIMTNNSGLNVCTFDDGPLLQMIYTQYNSFVDNKASISVFTLVGGWWIGTTFFNNPESYLTVKSIAGWTDLWNCILGDEFRSEGDVYTSKCETGTDGGPYAQNVMNTYYCPAQAMAGEIMETERATPIFDSYSFSQSDAWSFATIAALVIFFPLTLVFLIYICFYEDFGAASLFERRYGGVVNRDTRGTCCCLCCVPACDRLWSCVCCGCRGGLLRVFLLVTRDYTPEPEESLDVSSITNVNEDAYVKNGGSSDSETPVSTVVEVKAVPESRPKRDSVSSESDGSGEAAASDDESSTKSAKKEDEKHDDTSDEPSSDHIVAKKKSKPKKTTKDKGRHKKDTSSDSSVGPPPSSDDDSESSTPPARKAKKKRDTDDDSESSTPPARKAKKKRDTDDSLDDTVSSDGSL